MIVDASSRAGSRAWTRPPFRAARADGIPTGGTAPPPVPGRGRAAVARRRDPLVEARALPVAGHRVRPGRVPRTGDDPARPSVPRGEGAVGPDDLTAPDEGQRPRRGWDLLAGRHGMIRIPGDGQGMRG